MELPIESVACTCVRDSKGSQILSQFLPDLRSRPLTAAIEGLQPIGLFIGRGNLALEVALFEATSGPTTLRLQEAWRARRAGRSVPLLVVAVHFGRAWVCGPIGEDLPVHAEKDIGIVERVCAAALNQPDRHAALRFLAQALPSLDTRAPGLRNEGLFALHELLEDAPRRADWHEQAKKARTILGSQGTELLRRLGYTVERLDNVTHLLKGADRRIALGVLLDQSDVPEDGAPKFGNLSPVSYALAKADAENLDWVLLLQGDRLRLYPAKTGIGVGRRGRTETYVELQSSVLNEEHLPLLPLLFSADALKPEGFVTRLLEDSRRFADSLANRLRQRIYENVVPQLAKGMVEARQLGQKPDARELDLTYRMALTVLFRLLFVAYAEDRDLLPYRHSEAYRRRSLKEKALELAEHARNSTPIAEGTGHWDEVVRVWTAVEKGDAELSVPPYNGGLFSRLPDVSPAGAELARVRLRNEHFEPALRDLLLSEVDGVLQPVDFRSLGVREFGTIYEGLLESELSLAEQDLALDRKGNYVPARGTASRSFERARFISMTVQARGSPPAATSRRASP